MTRHLVVFRVGDLSYGLDLLSVDRVLPMVAVTTLPSAPDVVLGAINVHGSVIPVVDVGRPFGMGPRTYGSSANLLVARTRRRTVAIAVDAVLGVANPAEETMAPSGDLLPHLNGVAGVVPTQDGLLLVQDLDALLSLDEEDQLTQAIEAFNPDAEYAVA